MSVVRVRFAPSPTGALHAGNLRTALFNLLYARNKGGKFILRIEDTDAEKSDLGQEKKMMNTLRQLGLGWDEGPDVGGPYGPYRQSERKNRYADALETLIAKGAAYPCFCTPRELEQDRRTLISQNKPPRYLGRCRNLSEGERKEREKAGAVPSFRFLVEGAKIEFTDGVRGKVHFKTADIGDFVLTRSNGEAVYYLASAVDDIDMKITDVIRGEDHLSNTPKQLLIMRALGKAPPKYHHLSIILGMDGQKLSKRADSADIGTLLVKGYQPEAINTALAMLGWSGVNGKEALSIEAMAEKFDLSKVSKSPSSFDPARLEYINSKAIKKLSSAEFLKIIRPILEEGLFPFDKFPEAKLNKIMDAVRDSIHSPIEAIHHARQFVEPGKPDKKAEEILAGQGAKETIGAFKKTVAQMDNIGGDSLDAVIKSLTSQTGLKGKELFLLVRIALTGRSTGPKLKDLFDTLGRDEILTRIENRLNNY